MLANLAKPIVVSRLIAKAIDLALAMFLVALYYPVGPILGFLYILCADGLPGGKSLGKRVLRLRFLRKLGVYTGKRVVSLRVTNTATGKPATFQDSVIRNSTVAIPVLFLLVPLLGWLLWVVMGIPILAIEIYLMTRLEQHARLGDTMADTTVSLDVGTEERV
jgi:hypothetical protein